MNLTNLRSDLNKLVNPQKAKILQGFFKTGPGQYGEGDIFLGITVPQSRSLAKKYNNLTFTEISTLLKSKIHEERLIALIILVNQYRRATPQNQRAIFDFYLRFTRYINNWDLVDLSADKIVGEYLLKYQGSTLNASEGLNFDILRTLARSQNLWERRIAIITTYQFIKNNQFEPTIQIAKLLLSDKHDLIHKAVGWMLREVGKRDQKTLTSFLTKHRKQMPRTALRYAIEHFNPKTKLKFMAKNNFKERV